MNLEKAYYRVDKVASQKMLQIYCFRGKLSEAVRNIYQGSKKCVEVRGEKGKRF